MTQAKRPHRHAWIGVIGEGDGRERQKTGVSQEFPVAQIRRTLQPEQGEPRQAIQRGMANRNTAFAYEAGQMMSGLPAPGRRVGLFAASPTPDRLNMAGWLMFDAAVDWLVR